MADIKKRKKKLKDDLELLEDDFEDRITNVQKKVADSLAIVSAIKKNPLKAVGTSVIIGLAIGLIGNDKSGKEKAESGHLDKDRMTNLLFNEIKRVVARKAGTYLSEFIDSKVKDD